MARGKDGDGDAATRTGQAHNKQAQKREKQTRHRINRVGDEGAGEQQCLSDIKPGPLCSHSSRSTAIDVDPTTSQDGRLHVGFDISYMSASTPPSLLRLAVPNSKRCEGAHGTALVTISLNGGTAAKTHWYGMHAPMYLSSMHPVVHPSPSSTHMGCVAVRAKARHESYPVLPADGSVFPLQQHVRARQSKLTLLLDPVVAGVWGGVRWGE